MEWISVKERLPNDGQSVIVCDDVDGVCGAEYYSQGDGHFSTPYYGGDLGHRFDNVLFWMPMPEPPKKQQPDINLDYLKATMTLPYKSPTDKQWQKAFDFYNDRHDKKLNMNCMTCYAKVYNFVSKVYEPRH